MGLLRNWGLAGSGLAFDDLSWNGSSAPCSVLSFSDSPRFVEVSVTGLRETESRSTQGLLRPRLSISTVSHPVHAIGQSKSSSRPKFKDREIEWHLLMSESHWSGLRFRQAFNWDWRCLPPD